MGQCVPAAAVVASLELDMATKNKGGRAAKKPAAKSLKEKRAAKKAKQNG